MMFAALAGISLAATEARAEGDVKVGGAASVTSNSSAGSAALRYEHGKGLDTSIATGPIGPDMAKMNVVLKIDPVKAGGPLFVVDMPTGANVEASWGTDKKIILKAQTGASTDGRVTVRHTLTPAIDLTVNLFGLSASFSYDANKLLNKIPGAAFNYDSKAQAQFAPWGFTNVETKLNAPNLDQAKLFDMDMSEGPDFVSENFLGNFGVRAVTKPTFNYKTTKIVISGADGQLSDGSSELSVAASDGDYMEVMAAVEGTMTVKGGVGVQPFVHLDQAFGQAIPIDVGYDVFTKDFTTGATPVNFQTVLVHIPMPNVRVPSKGIDLGDAKKATKKITIENTGEMEATMTFSSSNKAFSVPGNSVTVPSKGKYELEVKFASDNAEAASSTITVKSSDADSPEQTFKIGANGADVSSPAEDGEGEGNAVQSQDGCGCKAAGKSTMPGWAGFGLLGLGAIVAFRRRKASCAAAAS